MTLNLPVNKDVKEIVNEIVTRNKWSPIVEIKYQPGSEIEEGMTSGTIAADIIGKENRYQLYLKQDLDLKILDISTEIFFANEIYFYEHIYPAFSKFLEEKKMESFCKYVPKYYGSRKNVIALENLKTKGFRVFDRVDIMNENHITLTLKTFARFHAVSFAFKDQEKEKYRSFVAETYDIFSNTQKNSSFHRKLKNLANYFVGTLNRVEEKHILDGCGDLAQKLSDAFAEAKEKVNEYSILTQGDSWPNNVMFLYEEEDNQNPTDIMLVDYQLVRQASPVFDIAYFFYTVAAEEALNKLDYYLEMYHEELSSGIRSLGSDSEVLYPFEVLIKEWKQHAKYGFAMAFMFVRAMLPTKQDECQKGKSKQDQYVERLKLIAEHMVKNGLL